MVHNLLIIIMGLAYLPKIYFGVNFPIFASTIVICFYSYFLITKSIKFNTVLIITTFLFIVSTVPIIIYDYSFSKVKFMIGLLFFPFMSIVVVNIKDPSKSFNMYQIPFILGAVYGVWQFVMGPNKSEINYLVNFGAAQREYLEVGLFRAGSIFGDPVLFSYLMLIFVIFKIMYGRTRFSAAWYSSYSFIAMLSLTRSSFFIILAHLVLRHPILLSLVVTTLFFSINKFIYADNSLIFLWEKFFLSFDMRLNALVHVLESSNPLTGVSQIMQRQLQITPRDLGIVFAPYVEFGLIPAISYLAMLVSSLLLYIKRFGISLSIMLILFAPQIISFSLDGEILSFFLAITIALIGSQNETKSS